MMRRWAALCMLLARAATSSAQTDAAPGAPAWSKPNTAACSNFSYIGYAGMNLPDFKAQCLGYSCTRSNQCESGRCAMHDESGAWKFDGEAGSLTGCHLIGCMCVGSQPNEPGDTNSADGVPNYLPRAFAATKGKPEEAEGIIAYPRGSADSKASLWNCQAG